MKPLKKIKQKLINFNLTYKVLKQKNTFGWTQPQENLKMHYPALKQNG